MSIAPEANPALLLSRRCGAFGIDSWSPTTTALDTRQARPPGSSNDRAHPGEVDTFDRHRPGRQRQVDVNGGLAGGVLSDTGLHGLIHQDMVDHAWVETSGLNALSILKSPEMRAAAERTSCYVRLRILFSFPRRSPGGVEYLP